MPTQIGKILDQKQSKLMIPIPYTPDNLIGIDLSQRSKYMQILSNPRDGTPHLYVDLTKMPEPHVGLHNVSLKMTNNYSKVAFLNFRFDIRLGEDILHADEDEYESHLAARITRTNSRGEVVITFNRELNTTLLNSNLSLLNSTLADIYIVPSKEHSEHPKFNISELNLTWSVTKVEGRELSLQLVFDKPASLSPYKPLDQLIIHFR